MAWILRHRRFLVERATCPDETPHFLAQLGNLAAQGCRGGKPAGPMRFIFIGESFAPAFSLPANASQTRSRVRSVGSLEHDPKKATVFYGKESCGKNKSDRDRGRDFNLKANSWASSGMFVAPILFCCAMEIRLNGELLKSSCP